MELFFKWLNQSSTKRGILQALAGLGFTASWLTESNLGILITAVSFIVMGAFNMWRSDSVQQAVKMIKDEIESDEKAVKDSISKAGMVLICVLLGSLILGPIPPAYSQEDVCEGPKEVTLNKGEDFGVCWDKNAEPDMAHYEVYQSEVLGEEGVQIDTILHSACLVVHCFSQRYTIDKKGDYYIYLKAVDTEGLKSELSEPVIVHIINKPPGKPSGCAAF